MPGTEPLEPQNVPQLMPPLPLLSTFFVLPIPCKMPFNILETNLKLLLIMKENPSFFVAHTAQATQADMSTGIMSIGTIILAIELEKLVEWINYYDVYHDNISVNEQVAYIYITKMVTKVIKFYLKIVSEFSFILLPSEQLSAFIDYFKMSEGEYIYTVEQTNKIKELMAILFSVNYI